MSGFSEDFFKKFEMHREQAKTQAEARQRYSGIYIFEYTSFDGIMEYIYFIT